MRAVAKKLRAALRRRLGRWLSALIAEAEADRRRGFERLAEEYSAAHGDGDGILRATRDPEVLCRIGDGYGADILRGRGRFAGDVPAFIDRPAAEASRGRGA